MKISILTQPLGHNYGGLIQAYALQQYLVDKGHSVETLDRRFSTYNLFRRSKRLTLNLARLMLGRIKSMPSNRREKIVQRNLIQFRDKNLRMSPEIRHKSELYSYYRENQFDAIVVGSDQVWRPKYSPCLSNFYLDFLDKVENKAKRISYAASFGVDEWEYSVAETEQCKHLARKFDALSVREKSAQALCQQYFDVTAELVVDPTLLLSVEKYRELFLHISHPEQKGRVLTYFIDPQPEKLEHARFAANHLRTELFTIKPNISISDIPCDCTEECLLPPVEDWLRSFDDAGFVVTDSFHGCIFSIIFNKPFIAIGNAKRGVSRFNSLLDTFGLSERLILPGEQIPELLLSKAVDWETVNHVRDTETKSAEAFIRNSLGDSV